MTCGICGERQQKRTGGASIYASPVRFIILTDIRSVDHSTSGMPSGFLYTAVAIDGKLTELFLYLE